MESLTAAQTELLEHFCAPLSKKSKYTTDKPFPEDGYVYATDGKSCVRIHCPDYPSQEGMHPPCQSLGWEKDYWDSEPLPMPDPMPEIEMVECVECKGTGKTKETKKCVNCDGYGEITCHECDHDYECRECNGEGELHYGPVIDCPECTGSGKVPEMPAVLRWENYGLSLILVKPIIELGGLIYCPHKPNLPSKLAFEEQNAEGLLMPVSLSASENDGRKIINARQPLPSPPEGTPS